MSLTQKQWELVEPHLVIPPASESGRGRPRCNPREVLNGIMWVCRTGAPWKDMPGKYPSYQTCHRYFQNWNRDGVWDRVLQVLATDLKRRGKIDITECFIDGTFASAKKGGYILEKLAEVKAPRSWQSQTLMVFLSPYPPLLQTTTR